MNMTETQKKPDNGQKIGYVRVSTYDQNLARQYQAFQEKGLDLARVFEDKASGKNLDRPGWKECRAYLRSGDVLYVTSFDRLARSVRHLQELVDSLTAEGIGLVELKHGIEFLADQKGKMRAADRFLFTVLGAFAELELDIIAERRQEGIAAARKIKGKYTGRKKALNPSQVQELMRLMAERQVPVAQLARKFGISPATAYNYKKNISKKALPAVPENA